MAAEAAEAALPVDEVGILNLRIVRSYFVPRERSACSALGEAVYWSAPTPAATVTALLAAGASVEDGGTGGWQPLNLALVSGDTNVAAVRALLAARADVEARPKTLPHQTPLLLAASDPSLCAPNGRPTSGRRARAPRSSPLVPTCATEGRTAARPSAARSMSATWKRRR